MKQTNIFFIKLLSFIFFILQTSSAIGKNDQENILDVNREVLLSFLWSVDPVEKILSKTSFGRDDRPSTLVLGIEALKLLYEGKKRNDKSMLLEGKKRVDMYLAMFDKNGIIPHSPYNEFPEGWWSCMDMGIGALIAQATYEVFNEVKYKDAAEKIILDLLRPTSQMGAVVTLPSGGKWLSEYAIQTTNPTNEYYVLNGFLFAFQALIMVENSQKTDKYANDVAKITQALKDKINEYTMKGNNWSYYMLNPKTVDTPSYLHYEKMQFLALWEITGDSFYLDQAKLREEYFKKNFPFYVMGNGEVLFSIAGGPHLYMNDIYNPTFKIIAKNGEEKTYVLDKAHIQKSKTNPFLHMNFNMDIDKVVWYARAGNREDIDVVAELNPIKVDKTTLITAPPSTTNFSIIQAKHAAKITGSNKVLFDPAGGTEKKADIIIKLKDPIKQPNDLYCILMSIRTERPTKIGIYLIDSKKNEAFRYYIPLAPSKYSVLLLKDFSFAKYENLKDISEIYLTLYPETDDENVNASYQIEISEIKPIKNIGQLYYYIYNIKNRIDCELLFEKI